MFGLGASVELLYVVDGFLFFGGICDINFNDIEFIQVLKDVIVGVIYGNCVVNGVVIIIIKVGSKNERFSIDFFSYYGVQMVLQCILVLEWQGYQAINIELLVNVGQVFVFGNDFNFFQYIDDININWQDEGYKDGFI